MLTRLQKTALAALILTVFLGGGLFLAIKNRFFPENQPSPLISVPEISPELEKELRGFLRRYLDAYKNAREKKNYEELKEFLAQSVIESFSPQHITDIDDYQIGEISIPTFLSGEEEQEEEQYVVRVKIFKNGLPINPPAGETWPVFIVREDSEFKVKTWFFVLLF